MDSVQVRSSGAHGPVVGWLWRAGTRYRFQYADTALTPSRASAVSSPGEQLTSFDASTPAETKDEIEVLIPARPLDPFCLPLRPEVFESASQCLDGPLALFGACLPHPNTLAVIKQVMVRRMTRMTGAERVNMQAADNNPLAQLAWASAHASVPSLNGLYFEPGTVGSRHSASGVWSALRAGKRAVGRLEGDLRKALRVAQRGEADPRFDTILSDLLPLPGHSLKFRFDGVVGARRVPGMLRIETPGASGMRLLRIRMAYLDLASACGLYAVKGTAFRLDDATLYWSYLTQGVQVPVNAPQPHVLQSRHGSHFPALVNCLDNPDAWLPVHAGSVHRIGSGYPAWQAYARLIQALGKHVNSGEAFRRLVFTLACGNFAASRKPPHLVPRLTKDGCWLWDFAPLCNLDPRGLPASMAARLRPRVQDHARRIGRALRMPDKRVERALERVYLGLAQWPVIAAAHHLDETETGWGRPAAVLPPDDDTLQRLIPRMAVGCV